MNKNTNLSLNIHYTGMQIPYWMGFSILTTFASVFLLSCGFTNGQIGIVLALANLLAVLLQPCVAALADRSVKLSLSWITAGLSLIMIVFSGLLIFLPKMFLPTAAIYVILIAFLMVLQPLTISLGTFYISRGYPLNFGLSRGIGSLAFAAASALTGRLVDRFSPSVILYLLVIVFTLFLLDTLGLDTRKVGGKYSRSVNETAHASDTAHGSDTAHAPDTAHGSDHTADHILSENGTDIPEEPCSLPVFLRPTKNLCCSWQVLRCFLPTTTF